MNLDLLKTLLQRLRFFQERLTLKRDIDEELRFHIEQRAVENIAAGMPPDEAAREARKRFGNWQSVREECREARGAAFGETTLQDIRFGIRMLVKSPGFTCVAVLTLALGIGANAAIFSVINSVLLRPLPYRDPDRLVIVTQSNPARGLPQITVSPANLRLWQEQNSVFEELGGEVYDSLNLTGIERPEHVDAAATTPNFFKVLGVPPILGRTFVADDKPPGGKYKQMTGGVTVLSYGLWQRAFGGDPGVIGQSITLSGVNYTVAGVMPRDFKIFNPPGVLGLPTGSAQPQLWTLYSGSTDEQSLFYLGFARLKPGVTLAQAQADMSAVAGRIASQSPSRKDWTATVHPLQEEIVGGARPALKTLLVAVGFVLLIACANVANLSLARSSSRVNEFAIRAALGAARSRLVRQLLVESAILALLGGSLGMVLARGSLAALVALQPGNLPRIDEVQLDTTVLCFSLVISVLTVLIFGLIPALYASAPDFNAALKDSGRGFTETWQRRFVRSILVVAEIALALVLLAGAGLMLNSFARLTRVPAGFETDKLITFDFSTTFPGPYTNDSIRLAFHRNLVESVQSQPGVNSAATAYGLPFGTMLNGLCVSAIEGRSTQESQREKTTASFRIVSPGYFQTMGIPMSLGRPFSEQLDTPNSLPAVIINEAFARKYFSGESPLGRRVRIFGISTNWCEIVGVNHDVKISALDAPTGPELYQPATQNPPWGFSLVVRSALAPRQVENLARSAVAALDKGLVPFNVRTMDAAISGSVAPQRFTTILTGLFAGLALTLTIVGIYGVVSYSVSQRTRDFGIRMALGASRVSVLGLVIRQGLLLAATGIAIGLAGSFALTRLIAAQLFGISANDPATFATVVALLVLITLAACYLPARRATKVDPMVALRHE